MAKYRIKIEALDPNETIKEDLQAGVECDGFFLGLDLEDEIRSIIYNLSSIDIAGIIVPDTKLLEAAIIARAIDEGRLMRENREGRDLLSVIKRMAGDD